MAATACWLLAARPLFVLAVPLAGPESMSLEPSAIWQQPSWDPNVPQLTRDLDLASQRLEQQQRQTALQLEQAGEEAKMLLGSFDHVSTQRALRLSAASRAAANKLVVHHEELPAPKKVALPQTVAEARNPAVAALPLVLEPVLSLFSYSTLLWIGLAIFSAVSTMCGVQLGKLYLGPRQRASADACTLAAAEAGRPANPSSSYYEYPGGNMNRSAARGLARNTPQDVEQEEEGVEAWVKVPAPKCSQSDARKSNKDWPGYLDDESDSEADRRQATTSFPLPSGRLHSSGYIDER